MVPLYESAEISDKSVGANAEVTPTAVPEMNRPIKRAVLLLIVLNSAPKVYTIVLHSSVGLRPHISAGFIAKRQPVSPPSVTNDVASPTSRTVKLISLYILPGTSFCNAGFNAMKMYPCRKLCMVIKTVETQIFRGIDLGDADVDSVMIIATSTDPNP